MEVFDFFEQLARHCSDGECEGCDAREFCYTAPRSMTEDLIRQTINRMNHCGGENTMKIKESIQKIIQEAIAESIQETVQEIIQELTEETKQE